MINLLCTNFVVRLKILAAEIRNHNRLIEFDTWDSQPAAG